MLFPFRRKDLCQMLSWRQPIKEKKALLLIKKAFPHLTKGLLPNKQKVARFRGEQNRRYTTSAITSCRMKLLRKCKRPLQSKLFSKMKKKKKVISKELNLWDILTCITAHKRRGKHTGYYSKILQSINYVSGKNHTLPLSFGFQPTY